MPCTKQQQNELFSMLPITVFNQYGFQPAFDNTAYKRIETEKYAFYPDLHMIVVGNSLDVIWETGKPDLCEINMENPKHVRELLRRAEKRLNTRLFALIRPSRKHPGMPGCHIHWSDPGCFYQKIPFDGSYLCYHPEEYDLQKDPDMLILAKCLFIARKYDPVQIVPYKYERPDMWGESTI